MLTYPTDASRLMDIDWLRGNGRELRLHGNRFLQLDVGPKQRVHLWSDLLPVAQRYPTWIHDHVFDFNSVVLAGQLIDVRYDVREAREWDEPSTTRYRMYVGQRRHKQDTLLVPQDDQRYVVLTDNAIALGRGHRYLCSAGVFHASTYVGHAMTLFTKHHDAAPDRTLPPRVLCPVGHLPDNEYNRYQYSQEDLWTITAEVLRALS